jgi:hypothetical protein
MKESCHFASIYNILQNFEQVSSKKINYIKKVNKNNYNMDSLGILYKAIVKHFFSIKNNKMSNYILLSVEEDSIN